ncbi:MAG: DUF881 domain-containing protein [Chloroflexi bacterium]|nr:DUF881 domain-containing protein [Chloroflexota bacterium]
MRSSVSFGGRTAQLTLAALSFVLGLFVAAQLQAQRRISLARLTQSTTEQALLISSLVENNARLRQEVALLQDQLRQYQIDQGRGMMRTLLEELTRIRIVNGEVEVAGPGVEVWIFGELSVLDLQDLVNEVRNTGAEGLAINGVRVVATTVITRQGGQMTVDGVAVNVPYVLTAIGNPATIERGLTRMGGVIDLLMAEQEGLAIRVEQKGEIILPACQVRRGFHYARVRE